MNKQILKTFLYVFLGFISIMIIVLLVNFVLKASNHADYAVTTVYGSTPKRVWATVATFLAIGGVGLGVISVCSKNLGLHKKKMKAILAIVLGLIAVISGIINLAVATGGPGSGNGVVGAALAIVLGFLSLALGSFALAGFRKSTK